jgi:anti-sigma B factor antagonist
MEGNPMLGVTMSTRSADGHIVAELRGELDIANASQVVAALNTVCDQAPGVIVLDLSGLAFIDSCGMEALVRAQRAARKTGSELQLAGLRPQARQVLDLFAWSREFAVLATCVD